MDSFVCAWGVFSSTRDDGYRQKIKTGQSYVNRNAPYKIIEYIYYLDIGRIGAAIIVVLYVELESSELELPSNAYAKLCPSHV